MPRRDFLRAIELLKVERIARADLNPRVRLLAKESLDICREGKLRFRIGSTKGPARPVEPASRKKVLALIQQLKLGRALRELNVGKQERYVLASVPAKAARDLTTHLFDEVVGEVEITWPRAAQYANKLLQVVDALPDDAPLDCASIYGRYASREPLGETRLERPVAWLLSRGDLGEVFRTMEPWLGHESPKERERAWRVFRLVLKEARRPRPPLIRLRQQKLKVEMKHFDGGTWEFLDGAERALEPIVIGTVEIKNSHWGPLTECAGLETPAETPVAEEVAAAAEAMPASAEEPAAAPAPAPAGPSEEASGRLVEIAAGAARSDEPGGEGSLILDLGSELADEGPAPAAATPPLEPTGPASVPRMAEPPPLGRSYSGLFQRIPGLQYSQDTVRGPAPEPAPAPAEPLKRHSAHALLEAPGAVVAEQEFELRVGLSPRPSLGVVGGEMALPPLASEPYIITVRLFADSFRLRAGERDLVELAVSAASPYPTVSLHLTPESADSDEPRTLLATYSVEGQIVGSAARSLRVLRFPAELPAGPFPRAPGHDMPIPPPSDAPDLTITIAPVQFQPGGLVFSVTSPWLSRQEVPEPVPVDIGTKPEGFLTDLLDEVEQAENDAARLNRVLQGICSRITQKLPAEVLDALYLVTKRAKAERVSVESRARTRYRPTVLILSSEPYVPWELTLLKQPLDPTPPGNDPPFLAAQAVVGRWVLAGKREFSAVAPPVEAEGDRIAAIWGVYDAPGWQRLVHAEEEGQALELRYAACRVDATSQEVFRSLTGDPPPTMDVFHFSLHGRYDPNSARSDLVLVDRNRLTPNEVRGTPLKGAPFVFLNACQVGAGGRILGDYAGMAEAFLFSGASGVIAPLWKIDDDVAKQIALGFYDAVFTGTRPAEYVRAQRGNFGPETKTSTWLAYQFFGHPLMCLRRRSSSAAPAAPTPGPL